MQITQPTSNTLTNITLLPSTNFKFRLKADPRFYINSAAVTDDVDEAAVRALFDEVNILEVPAYNGKQRYDAALIAQTTAAITDAKSTPATVAAWDKTFDYSINDIVSVGGVNYIALQPNKNNQPDRSPKYWAKIS